MDDDPRAHSEPGAEPTEVGVDLGDCVTELFGPLSPDDHARAEAWLVQELDKGIASADAGRCKPAEEIFDRLAEKYRRMAEEQERARARPARR